MSRAAAKNVSEWSFIAVLAVLCGILTVMQYRWTGDLARAESERLGANFGDRVQAIANEFDAQLEDACATLVPSSRDLSDLGVEKAHLACWKQWSDTKPLPMFTRVAVVLVQKGRLDYHEQNLTDGSLKAVAWPADWKPLRTILEGKVFGPNEPFVDPWGLVFEVPVFSKGRETEWVIFELDENCLQNSFWPAMEQKHLSLKQQPMGAIRVKAAREPSKVLHTSLGGFPGGKSITVELNSLGRSERGQTNFGPRVAMWRLEAVRTPAILENIVNASRQRNLGIAVVINMLILAAGVLLVYHTRKSRQLAQRQMQFVATVSHELRTPLTVIKGAAHNLQRGVVSDPERVSRYLGVITQNTDHLADMVEQVLAQAGAHRAGALKQAPVNLGEVLQAALQACEAETQAAGCVVESQIATDLPTITGDAAALRRVFQNLISNAAKHAVAGQWIGVEAEKRNGSIEIKIRDKGPGIPAAEQRCIFESFVRGKAAEEAQTRGSGLGLSLVKDLVEAHGGSVTLHSEPPDGCTFTVNLPTA